MGLWDRLDLETAGGLFGGAGRAWSCAEAVGCVLGSFGMSSVIRIAGMVIGLLSHVLCACCLL